MVMRFSDHVVKNTHSKTKPVYVVLLVIQTSTCVISAFAVIYQLHKSISILKSELYIRKYYLTMRPNVCSELILLSYKYFHTI